MDHSAFFTCITLLLLSLTSSTSPVNKITNGVLRRYTIKHEAWGTIRERPGFVFRANVRKFNASTPVMDAFLDVQDPTSNNWKTWVEGYERLGMEHIYRKSAISLVATACEFATGKFLINRGWRNFGNMPTSCPIKKGNYSMSGFVIEDKYLPPFIPGIHWRLDFITGPEGSRFTNQSSLMSYYCKVVYY